ncbi:response regulator transcription factor [Pedobacter sp. PAMC26386]|nr:response regulator transcription factor [Pedobacter sp. PAMC26386]
MNKDMASADTIKVGIIDDSEVVRRLLTIFLLNRIDPAFQVVLELETLNQIGQLNSLATTPDIILLDIDMPGVKGYDGIPLLQKCFPECAIIMFTDHDDDDLIMKCIRAGARGYLKKDSIGYEMIKGIISVVNGGSYISPRLTRKLFSHLQIKNNVFAELTKREQEIAEGILDGLSYKLIAHKLALPIDTVRDHIKRVYRKLNINSRGELAALIRI